MADTVGRHEDHDPLLVSRLVDDDLAGRDLATARAWITDCPGCASLHADLVALSSAMQAQPVPARSRDFRLSADDAARLNAEPATATARLTGVMTDPSTIPAHRSHDTTLVASLSDHSLAASERAAAEALVASCSACAALHADLETLVAATRAMPTPRRPIDYTLTPAHATRLRPNPWRRFVAAIGSSRDGVTRPLAIGLSTLGLVGLLVTSAPSVLQGGFGNAASSQAGTTEATSATAGAVTDTSGGQDAGTGAALAPVAPGDATVSASGAPERAVSNPAPAYGVTNAQPITGPSTGPLADGAGKGAVAGAAAEPSPPEAESTGALTASTASSGTNPMLVISGAFLLAGLGLFVLRWSVRRSAAG